MSKVDEFQKRVAAAVDHAENGAPVRKSAHTNLGPKDSRAFADRAQRSSAYREAARTTLASYVGSERVANLYDSDDAFSSALRDLAGPDFEYPDFAHLSVTESIRKADKLGGELSDSFAARGAGSALTDVYEVVEDHRPMGDRFSKDIRGRDKCVAYLANVNRTFNITVFQYREDFTLQDATDEILAQAWPETATLNALRPGFLPETVVYLPTDAHRPKDLGAFDVFLSMAAARARYPDIPDDGWREAPLPTGGTVQLADITKRQLDALARARRTSDSPLVRESERSGPFGDPWLVIGTQEDRNTILAALRFYQERGMGEPANRSDAIHDIATNGDEDISYDDGDIDALCERVNSAAMLPPRLTHASINETVLEAGIQPTFQQSWKLCELLDQKPLSHSADHFPPARAVDSKEEAQTATPSLRMRA